MAADVDIVVPTVGRPSLARLLGALAAAPPPPGRILLVDDRPDGAGPLPLGRPPATVAARVAVLRSGGRGPAAARNVGWRAARAAWIAFLDDDVVPAAGWAAALARDLAAAGPAVAGVQGRIRVPLPPGRRPTDWERNVAALERARWATADLAYRRAALAAVGGFDERFRRNYREDADLALRLVDRGWAIAQGARTVDHPVGPADRWVSVRLQAGNGDDVLMDRLHGRGWRARAGAPRGRARRHAAVAAAGAVAAAATAWSVGASAAVRARGPAGRRRAAGAGGRGRAAAVAVAAGAAWLAGTAELAWARIAPGPRTADELATVAATSVALPFAATAHRLRGRRRWRGAQAAPLAPPTLAAGDPAAAGIPRTRPAAARPAAVLLDRDGTLVVDVPYNGDPARVVPMPGARAAVAALRAAGVPTAVVSNQSGIARGLLTADQVAAVNRRVEQLLGPLGPWLVCPHGPADGCGCRKPAPGLIVAAARRLGVAPARCAVIGDIGADVEAARAAGARGLLVPTARTRPEEIAGAAEVAPDLPAAVRRLLEGPR